APVELDADDDGPFGRLLVSGGARAGDGALELHLGEQRRPHRGGDRAGDVRTVGVERGVELARQVGAGAVRLGCPERLGPAHGVRPQSAIAGTGTGSAARSASISSAWCSQYSS